jgi:hypothetical protein
VHRCGAGIDGDGMPAANVFGEFFFEFHRPLAGGEPAGAQAFYDVRNIVIINQWTMKGDRGVQHVVVLPVGFLRPNGFYPLGIDFEITAAFLPQLAP